jgi:hypothetical protein
MENRKGVINEMGDIMVEQYLGDKERSIWGKRKDGFTKKHTLDT